MLKKDPFAQAAGWCFIGAMLIVLLTVAGCTMTAGIDPDAGTIHGSIETIWDGKDSD